MASFRKHKCNGGYLTANGGYQPFNQGSKNSFAFWILNDAANICMDFLACVLLLFDLYYDSFIYRTATVFQTAFKTGRDFL